MNKIKAQTVWYSVNTKLNTNLSLFDIDDLASNFFISLVSFGIYIKTVHYYKSMKDWKNYIVIFEKRNVMLYYDAYRHTKKIMDSKLEFLEHFLSCFSFL